MNALVNRFGWQNFLCNINIRKTQGPGCGKQVFVLTIPFADAAFDCITVYGILKIFHWGGYEHLVSRKFAVRMGRKHYFEGKANLGRSGLKEVFY